MPFESPNYTQHPNEAYDIWLGQLPNAHYCVLSYLIRHTIGFHRDVAAITYEEMIKGRFYDDGRRMDYGCGVRSSKTIAEALANLEALDLIERLPGKGAHGGRGRTSFRVKVAAEQAVQAALTPTADGSLPSKEPRSLPSKEPAPGTLPSEEPALYLVKSGTLPSKEPIKVSKETCKETEKEIARAGGVAPAPVPVPADSARAREDPSYAAQDLDPLEPGIMALAKAIHQRWGKYAKREHLEEWCRALWDVLGDCTAERRALFVEYLFSDAYLAGRAYPRGVLDAIETDGARWRAEGYPARKGRRDTPRARAGARHVSPAAFPSPQEIEEQKRAERAKGGSYWCRRCKRIEGAYHSEFCASEFAGQIVRREEASS